MGTLKTHNKSKGKVIHPKRGKNTIRTQIIGKNGMKKFIPFKD